MPESLEVSVILAVTPAHLAGDWLDSEAHAAFTGSPASIDPRPGGAFTAWDGYISGVTEAILPEGRIIQRWRTSDFPEEAEDSVLELVFDWAEGGTLLTLIHGNLPDGTGETYAQGWEEHYFVPMRAHYGVPEGVE